MGWRSDPEHSPNGYLGTAAVRDIVINTVISGAVCRAASDAECRVLVFSRSRLPMMGMNDSIAVPRAGKVFHEALDKFLASSARRACLLHTPNPN
jgi:hypothetical protein